MLEDPLDILKRATLTKYMSKYKALGYTTSQINTRMSAIGWNGIIPEVFEEAITEYAQAPIEGRKPEVSWEWLMQTIGAIAGFGGLTASINAATQNGVELKQQGAIIDIQIDPKIEALTSDRPNNKLLQEAETIISGKGKFGEEGIQRLEEIKSQLPENQQSQVPDIIIEAARQDVIDFQKANPKTETTDNAGELGVSVQQDAERQLAEEARKYKNVNDFIATVEQASQQVAEVAFEDTSQRISAETQRLHDLYMNYATTSTVGEQYDSGKIDSEILADIWNKVNVSGTVDTTEALKAEARKYKSAEEFVKTADSYKIITDPKEYDSSIPQGVKKVSVEGIPVEEPVAKAVDILNKVIKVGEEPITTSSGFMTGLGNKWGIVFNKGKFTPQMETAAKNAGLVIKKETD